MENSAQKVLITEAGSLLGFKLAQLFLNYNNEVFGVGVIPAPHEILKNPKYTHLDIDLSQPLPSHIPQLDLIIHLLGESTQTLKNFSHPSQLTATTNHIISLAKSSLAQVILASPVNTSLNFYDAVAGKDQAGNLKIFFIGDIYGPEDPLISASSTHPHTSRHHREHFYFHNELANLIAQAITQDKIILEDEGARIVFPTFIEDAIFAFDQFLTKSDKNIQNIVSDSSRSALTCAYSIQKIAQVALNKELKLYFSGPEQKISSDAYPHINPNSLGFKPKFNLEEGLKKTFEFYKGKSTQTISFAGAEEPGSNRLEKHISQIQSQKRTQTKVGKITSKIPRLSIGLNIKRIILAMVIVFFLTVAKTGADFYLGINSFKIAKDSLFAGDFQKASQKASSAASQFQAAENKLRVLTKPFSLIFPSKTKNYVANVSSLQSATIATSAFSQGLDLLIKNVSTIASGNSTRDESLDFESINANLKLAYRKFTESYQLADRGDQDTKTFQDLANYSLKAYEFTNFIPKVVGKTEAKKYLVLVQYNDELRPGGGFIGSLGNLTFENGHLDNYTFESTYKMDSNLKEIIKPPAPLREKLFVDKLFLRDSNFSPDFSINSATALDLYKKETAQSVDGVIAFDLTFIKDLLKIIGPVNIYDGNDKISSEIFNDKFISYSKEGRGEEFLTQVISHSLDQLIKNFQTPQKVNWQELANTITNSLSQKHLLMQFESEDLSNLAKIKGWDNSLPPVNFDPAQESAEIRDILAISEANLGANRVNEYLDRKIDYKVEFDAESALNSTLTLTYKNNSQSTTWPEGNYINYLRVFAPSASTLVDYKNGESSDLDEVEVSTVGNLTVFSTMVEVPIGQTREVKFSYRVSKNTTLAQTPTYHLYVSKQPGTEKDPLTFALNLSDGFKIKSVNNEDKSANQQSTRIETNLETDRQLEIEVIKN